MFERGTFYPPEKHSKRIAKYRENKQLFVGNHYDVFERIQKFPQDDLYISTNLAGLICKKSADFLFGDSPTFSAGREQNSPEQEKLDEWVADNDLAMKLQQSATGNAYRGDAFIKVRWGQKWDGKVSEQFDPFRVIIELQNPAYVFPETSEGDASQIEVFHIAYPVYENHPIRPRWVLNVETHEPGKILYRKFEVSPANYHKNEVTSWNVGGELRKERNEVDTGVPFPLVVHIPNYATDDNWEGLDDISEHKPLFDELNRRFTAVSDILDKHADPAIAVPSGVLGEDEYGNPAFVVGRDKVFEVLGKDDVVPQYITWNGQLQSAFQEIGMVEEQILMNAEIPAVALGKGDSGTSGSSGLAIKFRMNSLLAKINRKRQFYDKGLKEVFRIAQMLEISKLGPNAGFEPFDVKIHFKDGLPSDENEQANIMNTRTGGKATISQKTALMRMDGLSEEQADAEIAQIEAETEKENERVESMFASQSVFNEETEPDVSEINESENEGADI